MRKTGRRHRSDSKRYTYHGETHTVIEWSEILQVDPKTIKRRLREGRSPDEVFSADLRVTTGEKRELKKYIRKLEREAEERKWYGKDNTE